MWSSPSFFLSSGWWWIVSARRLALDDGNNTVIDWISYYTFDNNLFRPPKITRRPFISMGRKALNSGAVAPSLMSDLSWLPPTVPLTVAKKGITRVLSILKYATHFNNTADKIADRESRFRASQYTARFGEYNLRTTDPGESEIFQISEIRIHPQFTGTGFYNDLALFKLERPVSFSDYIQPICLPSNVQRTESFVGQVPTIVGWGTTYYGENIFFFFYCGRVVAWRELHLLFTLIITGVSSFNQAGEKAPCCGKCNCPCGATMTATGLTCSPSLTSSSVLDTRTVVKTHVR